MDVEGCELVKSLKSVVLLATEEFKGILSLEISKLYFNFFFFFFFLKKKLLFYYYCLLFLSSVT